MRELSLHLLDIAENSIAAQAATVQITVIEDTQTDRLYMSVQDDGKGMDAETVAKVVDPFVTSRTTRKVGLGIPLLKEAAEACNGSLKIESAPGKGTLLEVEFQRSHIDRMPMGNLGDTLITLLVANPAVHWIFRYRFNQQEFVFDDEPLKEELDGISLTEPFVLKFLNELIKEGIHSLQAEPIS